MTQPVIYVDRSEVQPGKLTELEAAMNELVEFTEANGAGIEVTIDPETYPNGRFARLHDPEGNPIELWQPQGRDGPRAGQPRK